MFYPFRIFAFTFANYFENLLQQEIAKIDLNKHIRRPGVLVARGLVAPTIIAVYKSTCLALHSRKSPFARACLQLGGLCTRTDQNQTRNTVLFCRAAGTLRIPKSVVE